MNTLTHFKPRPGKSLALPKKQEQAFNPSKFKWVITERNGYGYNRDHFSTQRLIDDFDPGTTGSATLFFQDNEVHAPISAGRKAWYALKKGSEGVVVGAVAGGIGLMAVACIAGLFDAPLAGDPAVLFGTTMATTGAIGLGRGIYKAVNADKEKVHKYISGKLSFENGEALFQPRGEGKIAVDLNKFKNAAIAPKIDGKAQYGQQWWNSEPEVEVGRMYRDTWNPKETDYGGGVGGG